jgi:hypothetical protein
MAEISKKDLVVINYVAWSIATGNVVSQKYFDYLDSKGLLQTAVKEASK